MAIEDRVPQRVFGAVLPVAPLVRDLTIRLEGEDDTIGLTATLQVGESSTRISVLKGITAYEGNGVIALGFKPSDWWFLGRDIDARFALPAGTGEPISTLFSRISEVAVVAARSRGILGVIELQEELRGVLRSSRRAPRERREEAAGTKTSPATRGVRPHRHMGPPGPRGRDRQRDRARSDRPRGSTAPGRARSGRRHRGRRPPACPMGHGPSAAVVGPNGSAGGAGASRRIMVDPTLAAGGGVLGDRSGPRRCQPRLEALRPSRRNGTRLRCARRRPRVGGPFPHVTSGKA